MSASLFGFFGGAISVILYQFVYPKLIKFDIRGVLITHGIMGILGFVASMVVFVLFDEKYKLKRETIFPNMLEIK